MSFFALSDWATACWNQDGNICIARMNIGDGETIMAFKNRIVVKRGEEWILDVNYGFLVYKNLRIFVDRAKFQEGIYFYIRNIDTDEILVGISVRGFITKECKGAELNFYTVICDKSEFEWVGITVETLEAFLDWLKDLDVMVGGYIMVKPNHPKDFWYYNQGTLTIYERCSRCKIDNRSLQEILRDEKLRTQLMQPTFL